MILLWYHIFQTKPRSNYIVETECRKVGLRLNAKKTEVMAFNIDKVELRTLDG
jgi:hypothetical protein